MLAFVRGVRFLRPVRLLVCGRSATAGASGAAIRCVFTVGRVLCFHLSSCLRRARAHTHTRVCCQVSVSSGATDTVVSATSSFPVSLTSLFSRLVFMIMIIIVIIMIFCNIAHIVAPANFAAAFKYSRCFKNKCILSLFFSSYS